MSTVIVKNRFPETYEDTIKLVLVPCAACGIPFGIPYSYDDSRREDHEGFYCPNGHSNYYPEGSKTKREIELQDKLREEKARAEKLAGNEKFWIERWQAKVDEVKSLDKTLKRINKRIKAGVCPCCNRTFQNLSEHMAMVHGGKKFIPKKTATTK